MKRSTIIKIVIAIIVIGGIGFMLNPFYWLMKPAEKPGQPELSQQEAAFFDDFKNKCGCSLERFYYNRDSKGNDTLNTMNYDKIPFDYSLSIDKKDKSLAIDQDSIYKMAIYLKDHILHKNKNLKKLTIHLNYDGYEYLYDNERDALILQKK